MPKTGSSQAVGLVAIQPPASRPSPEAARKARLLVIEDDAAMRGLTVETLEEEGYSVEAAADGPSGIALAHELRPDLILCDIMMTGLDGYAVLAGLRRDPVSATTPVIFLTGMGESTALRKGMELGADDYLAKPFSRAGLVRAVAARLSRSVAMRRDSLRRLDALHANLARALPHEFLTPLTAVMGLSSMLMEDGAVPTADVREVACGIFRSGAALQRGITKFLLYAELEAGADKSPGQCLAPDIVTSVITGAACAEAARVGRESDLAVEVEAVPIAMPRHHLEALVTELVDNAMKFSKSPSTVTVRCGRRGDACVLMVADLGQGMTPAHVDGLARAPFLRRHQDQPGSGLGLAIVRRLTELHGGEVTFDTAPGRGTAVNVRLPRIHPGDGAYLTVFP
jgi:two-component system sensor histidine kinase/response regulator